MFIRSILVTMLAISVGPALAQSQKTALTAAKVIASDPQSFVDYFEESGYPARLTEDSVGDPLVEYRVDGEKLSLFFYDCTDNADCQAVQFYSGYRTEGSVDLELLNAWNSDRRFIRAYLTEDDVARIEMDIATSIDGLTHRDFDALVELWTDSIVLFEDHINW